MIQLSFVYPEIPVTFKNNIESPFILKVNSDEKTKVSLYLSYYDVNGELQTWSFVNYITVQKMIIEQMIFFTPKVSKSGRFVFTCYRREWTSERLFWVSPEFKIK